MSIDTKLTIDSSSKPMMAHSADKTQPQKDPKLWKAVKDFESILIYQMLKSMRQTVMESGLTEESPGKDYYMGMFDSEVAKSIASQQNDNMAETLYRQLSAISKPASNPIKQPVLNQPVDTAVAEKQVVIKSSVKSENSASQQLPNEVIALNDSLKQPLQSQTKFVIQLPIRVIDLPDRVPFNENSMPYSSVKKNFISDKVSHAYLGTNLTQRISYYQPIIQEAADKYNVDPDLIAAVIAQESAGQSNEVSSKGAIGLMQLMEDTAQDMGVHDIKNPRDNILGGTKYLNQMLDRFDGDLTLALAAYNAGPSAVAKYNGVPPYKETQDYVKKVRAYYEAFKANKQDL
jgi:Rod binding domain-containing protein